MAQGTEVAEVPPEEQRWVVVKATGEQVALHAPDAQLAKSIVELKDLADDVAAAIREVGGEVLARMDRAGSWTVKTPDGTFTAPSPAAHTELDGGQLYEALGTLVEDGALDESVRDQAAFLDVRLSLSPAAWEALLQWPPIADGRVRHGDPKWKAHKPAAERVAKTSDRARNLVDSCRVDAPSERRATLKAVKS